MGRSVGERFERRGTTFLSGSSGEGGWETEVELDECSWSEIGRQLVSPRDT